MMESGVAWLLYVCKSSSTGGKVIQYPITLEREASENIEMVKKKESRPIGYPDGPVTTHLRPQKDRGRPYACRLQHPEGVDTAG